MRSIDKYNHKICDLCGSSKFTGLLKMKRKRGMTSDSRIVETALNKIYCKSCGLIRNGHSFSGKELETHYKIDYVLNRNEDVKEHVFFRNNASIARSDAISEWIMDILGKNGFSKNLKSIFEVGAGQGNLLKALIGKMKLKSAAGCELNIEAVNRARTKGLDITYGGTSEIIGKYDMILSFGVLEHVYSPKKFINEISTHLKPGGIMFLIQPMQDVPSYDIFFIDHLHHFSTRHLKMYAESANLDEVVCEKSPWFSKNFSGHILKNKNNKTVDNVIPTQFVFPEVPMENIRQWDKIFKTTMDIDKSKGYAIFGVGEIATMLYCYGGLELINIQYGIDDNPEKYRDNIFNLKVRKLEELTDAEKRKLNGGIILTLPKKHVEMAKMRCKMQNLSVIEIF